MSAKTGLWKFWWVPIAILWVGALFLVHRWFADWGWARRQDYGSRVVVYSLTVLPLTVMGLWFGFRLDRLWIARIDSYGKRTAIHLGLLAAGIIAAGLMWFLVDVGLFTPMKIYRGDTGWSWVTWSGVIPPDPVDAMGPQLSRSMALLALGVLGVLPGAIAIGAWLFSREDLLRGEHQRRAAQIFILSRRGRLVPWNLSATFLMGFYALGHRFWWGMYRVIWSSLWTRVFVLAVAGATALLVVLESNAGISALAIGLPVCVIACVSVHCGLSGYKWRYVFAGTLPPRWDASELPQDVSAVEPISLAPRGVLRLLPSPRFLLLIAAMLYLTFARGGHLYVCKQNIRNVGEYQEYLTELTRLTIDSNGRFGDHNLDIFHPNYTLSGVSFAGHGESKDAAERRMAALLSQQTPGGEQDRLRVVVRKTGATPATGEAQEVYLWRVSRDGRLDMDINAELIRAGLAEPIGGHPREKEFMGIRPAPHSFPTSNQGR